MAVVATGVGERTLVVGARRIPLYPADGAARVVVTVEQPTWRGARAVRPG